MTDQEKQTQLQKNAAYVVVNDFLNDQEKVAETLRKTREYQRGVVKKAVDKGLIEAEQVAAWLSS